MTHEYHGEVLIILGMIWFFGYAIFLLTTNGGETVELNFLSAIITLAIWWWPAWKLGSIGLDEVKTQMGFNKWAKK